MLIKPIIDENRKEINDFIKSKWFSTDMAVRGKIIDMTLLNGFAAYDNSKIIGLVTYEIEKDECEIMSLDSTYENKGIGTALLNKVIDTASKKGCMNVKLITTNDNLHAMLFYQRKGFDMVKLYYNAVDISRKLKPSIPKTGCYNIPIKHEIEFKIKTMF